MTEEAGLGSEHLGTGGLMLVAVCGHRPSAVAFVMRHPSCVRRVCVAAVHRRVRHASSVMRWAGLHGGGSSTCAVIGRRPSAVTTNRRTKERSRTKGRCWPFAPHRLVPASVFRRPQSVNGRRPSAVPTGSYLLRSSVARRPSTAVGRRRSAVRRLPQQKNEGTKANEGSV